MSEVAQRPIGVMDSGLGGLSVLRELHQRFPHENFVYLGDTARIPYGIKSSRVIRKYLEQNLGFLLKQNIKAAVVACNSASSVAENLDFPLPVYEVIGPGAKAALSATRNKIVGVVGTRATISKKTYVVKIQKLDPTVQVFQQACPLLVPLVEEGWDDDPLTNLVIYRYLSPLLQTGVDTIVLGCTHYPILRSAIQKVVGHSITLVDSAGTIADQIEADLQSQKLLPNHSGSASRVHIMATDISDYFQQLAQNIMSHLKLDPIEQVDL